MPAPTAAVVFDDYNTSGVPSSGAKKVKKSEARSWGAWLEATITAFTSAGGSVYPSLAAINSDLSPANNAMAWVVSDSTAANNGIYRKIGASGAGSWVRIADLPYSFISASDVGAGAPDAIQATTNLPVSGSALVWLAVSEANTGSPVTVSFNGETPLTIKTNGGADLSAGGLVSGMIIMGIVSGSTFRLVSDQASAAILAAAEAAAAAASAYADFIRNNWFVAGPFTGSGASADYLLPINPGSVNNMFPVVGGVAQLITDSAYSLVSSGGNYYIRINVPTGIKFEVRIGNAVNVNTPADGSVTTPKLADDAVTYAKMQNISATLRLSGRKSAGAGDMEEISAAELRDLFSPAGSVVDSVVGSYAAATAITAIIPLDDTIPQITEGTQIISVSITPKSTANKLRIRYSGFMGGNGVFACAHAVFNGNANAIHAGGFVTPVSNYFQNFCGEVEYAPGSISPQTISLRVGVQTGSQTLYVNGNPSGGTRLYGGSAATRLIIEEIKA
jgi:hypothetical protein